MSSPPDITFLGRSRGKRLVPQWGLINFRPTPPVCASVWSPHLWDQWVPWNSPSKWTFGTTKIWPQKTYGRFWGPVLHVGITYIHSITNFHLIFTTKGLSIYISIGRKWLFTPCLVQCWICTQFSLCPPLHLFFPKGFLPVVTLVWHQITKQCFAILRWNA